MKKWYKETYFDRRNWIMEYFEKLNLNVEETMLLLLLEFCRSSNKEISYEYLMKKMQMSSKQVDGIMSALVSKHYLVLKSDANGLIFDIDNIFDFDPELYEINENRDVYDILSDAFGKPLTPSELQKVNDLLEQYGQKSLLNASRIAEANGKMKLSYIEGILRNEK